MNNNQLLDKLDGLVSRFEEVSLLVTDPSVIADQQRFVKLTREYKELEDVLNARKEYIQCLQGIEEAKMMLQEDDQEMREMAREELAECERRQPELEEKIKMLLIPKDPEDARNAVLEIRGGTGGDEAALFAGDLFKMYQRYCESKGWQVAIQSVSEGAVGGFKEIVCMVTGDSVYGTLKYESGVHRLPRERPNAGTQPCAAGPHSPTPEIRQRSTGTSSATCTRKRSTKNTNGPSNVSKTTALRKNSAHSELRPAHR